MRGRKNKPDYLKLVQGDPGKRGVSGDTPKPSVTTMKPPDWLDRSAAAEWRRLMPELVRWGLFSKMDMSAFAAYCAAYSQWRKAMKVLAKKGLTYESNGRFGTMLRAHPMVAIANEAQRQMMRFGSEFGLSPAARVRLKGTAQGDLFSAPAGKKSAAGNPWDDL